MHKSILRSALFAVLPAVALATSATAGCHHGECYEKVQAPDVYATVTRPVVVAPPRTEVYHSPAVYGTVARQVEVAPARAWHSYTPAVYATVERDVVVAPGGYSWQRSVGWHGHERMCKVYHPAVTRRVSERVMVAPPERLTHVKPAVYATVHRPVMLQEARTHRVYRPAVVAYHRHDVLVRRGGHYWQRSW